MKAVILAGGLGTRISEETGLRPKPMIEIGSRPLLWHIFKIYATHNITDFIVCCGYKGYVIKEYFANYFLHMSDVTIDLSQNTMEVHQKYAEPWRVTLVDTGESTQTGGRIKRIESYLDGDFCLTYGDGLSNVNIKSLVNFHKSHGRKATMTVVKPPGRFGAVNFDEDLSINEFTEKPKGDGAWINGGFFVLSPDVLDLIEGDSTLWERGPLESLAAANELKAYKHKDFWHSMDTLRDKVILEEMWSSGAPPWKVWS